MPLIKSAIKKVRKDKARTLRNQKQELQLKKLIKEVRRNKTVENLKAVFSALDKAAKVNLIHKNKASRLKSSLSKIATSYPAAAKPSSKKKAKPKKRLTKTQR